MARTEVEAFEPEHFIDRDRELKGFDKLLKPERPKSVMLIEGGELMGKSWLLDWMGRLCSPHGGQTPLPVAKVDFWEQQHELQDLLGLVRLIRDALRQPGYFSDLNATINLFTRGRPAALVAALQGLAGALVQILGFTEVKNLSRILGIEYGDLEGGETGALSVKCYSLVATLEDQQRLPELFARMKKDFPDRDLEQEEQAIATARTAGAVGAPVEDLGNPLPVDGRSRAEAKINESFFACLHKLEGDHGPVIVLFDSVELAPDWAQSWIRDELMGQLQAGSLKDVVVIIAGRDISKLKRADPADLMVSTALAGFDQESIRKFLESYQVPYDDEKLSSLMEWSQGGKPGMLALMTADKRLAQKQKEDPFFQ